MLRGSHFAGINRLFGGPLFHRELATAPRGWRLYLVRTVYVGALFGLAATAWLILFGGQPVRSLADLARFGAAALALIAPVQLALATAFSALLAAAAVAQEKDRKTLDLLLMTRLGNVERVVGKLLASLLIVLMLVLAGLPMLMFLALLGGISYEQIARACGVTAMAAVVAGSLGSTLAFWRDKTFQTLAITALVLALWLLLGEAVAGGAFGREWLGASCNDWATAISPLRAIMAAVRATPASAAMFAAAPALGDAVRCYIVFAAALAGLLNLIAVALVRVWNPQQEARPQTQEERRDAEAHALAGGETVGTGRSVHDAPGQAREVWDNPILWREICTWAYGRKVILVRAAYLLVFAVCAAAMFRQSTAAEAATGSIPAAAQAFLPLAVLGLLLVNALAVTSLTNERDAKALDLLLVTDLSPKEIIFGKLGGVFYNAKEMVLLPVGLCLAAWATGRLSGENLVFLLLCMAVADAFAAMLGIHCGMAHANSRTAVAVSLGTLLFLLLGIAVCMRMMVAFQTDFNYQLQAFATFMLGGGIGLYVALGSRNPSQAMFWATMSAPFMTFFVIVSFLKTNYGAAALVMVFVYGFTTLTMLIPAIAEFDVATGRTTAKDA